MNTFFFVHGKPEPKGSMKPINVKGLPYTQLVDNNPKVKAWQRVVNREAFLHRPPGGPSSEGVTLFLTFQMRRPKGLPRRVVDHIKKPDCDKLQRAVKDALKGIFYRDDSQVFRVIASKVYATTEREVGVCIEVMEGSPPRLRWRAEK